MSDNNENKRNTLKRWIGKLRNLSGTNGGYQQIYLDNLKAQNDDGTPNEFYKGALVWFDQETGKRYLVKQIGFQVPQAGMGDSLLQKGFSCYITINLADTKYAVEELS